ncbi:hypothetical protein [Gallaecimonas sp. GXIMD4217]|uniref:hypothetical protein n=1 Tax=Gallaecimonas sp. GXIMD4217 TaxID=3131927 RepID=UPI00311B1036
MRDWLGSKSLGTRLLLVVLAFSSVVTAAIVSITLYAQYQQSNRVVEARMASLENTVLPGLIQALWDVDPSLTELQLKAIMQLPDVAGLHLASDDGQHYRQGAQPGHKDVDRQFRYALVYKGDKDYALGDLQVSVSYRRIYSELWEDLLILLVAQGAKTFMVSLFILAVVYRMITRHLARLAEDIGRPLLDDDLRLERDEGRYRDELSVLLKAINRMRDHLKRQLASLNRSEVMLKKQNQRLTLEVNARTQELRYQRDLAQLLSELSITLVNTGPMALIHNLTEALERLGRFLDLEAMQLLDSRHGSHSLLAQWPQDGAEPPLAQMRWLRDKISHAGPVLVSHRDLPPEAEAERRFLADFPKESSLVFYGLYQEGRQVGVLCLRGAHINHQWQQANLTQIARFTVLLSALLVRIEGPVSLFSHRELLPSGDDSPWLAPDEARAAIKELAGRQCSQGSYLSVMLVEFAGQGELPEEQFQDLSHEVERGFAIMDSLLVKLSPRLVMAVLAGPSPQATEALSTQLHQELAPLARPFKVAIGGITLVPESGADFDSLRNSADHALFRARQEEKGLFIESIGG